MELQTKYFGVIEYDESDTIHFPVGILGFEEEHAFLLLPFAESHGTMFCLQSTATPGLAFIAMDPFALTSDYEPLLKEEDLRLFDAADWQNLSFCVLCVVKDPIAHSTVNLKCPIAFHLKTKVAYQIIMETDRYGMRHPLAEFAPSEEAAPC